MDVQTRTNLISEFGALDVMNCILVERGVRDAYLPGDDGWGHPNRILRLLAHAFPTLTVLFYAEISFCKAKRCSEDTICFDKQVKPKSESTCPDDVDTVDDGFVVIRREDFDKTYKLFQHTSHTLALGMVLSYPTPVNMGTTSMWDYLNYTVYVDGVNLLGFRAKNKQTTWVNSFMSKLDSTFPDLVIEIAEKDMKGHEEVYTNIDPEPVLKKRKHG
jgi:hypothetical protein